jgi:quercetin 2,3-dioxygenase
MADKDTKLRTIASIIPAQRTLEGGGVPIRRAFPTQRWALLDPFLLFDHMGPLDLTPGQNLGFPDHPHRGFETVTYLLEGVMEHRDSFGHHGTLEPGDVQWMTAGSGLVHSEMPGAEFVRRGGRLQGFQIWINLPRQDKMKAPHYQEIKATEIPTAHSPDGTVTARVIAGEALGTTGAVKTHTPVQYVHFTLAPGASVVQDVPASLNALAYTISGQASYFGHNRVAEEGSAAQFAQDGSAVSFHNSGDRPLELLFLAGEPLREPVARYGPFVMNTQEELYQAFEDYRSGKMGSL